MAPKKKAAAKPEPQDQNVISTLFGRIKVTQVEVDTERKFNVFDYVNDINFGKQYLYSEETASEFNPYTMNRAMTIFADTFVTGEFLNANYHLDKKMQHDYLFYSVQKRKRWKEGGWLKRTDAEKKELKTLSDVAQVVQYNMKRTKQFWSVLSDAQRREFLATYVYPDLKNAKK